MTEPLSDHAFALAAPRLRPFVAAYTGYRYEGWPSGLHAGLPSRHLTFIVALDDGVDVCAMPDAHQSPKRFGALVGGLHARPATIRYGARQH
ncbi:MAG: AraC family transcriptional regulator, partial [Candidatus Dormibacteraeota bacterium]|nr:AraC family transcriptional regulator [Candidatus Dormibacteraeota bacterium]